LEVHDIRRQRLGELAGNFESVAEFSRFYALNETYVRQLLGGHRNLGEKSARNLEKTLKLPSGWLSTSTEERPSAPPSPGMRLVQVSAEELELIGHYRRLTRLSARLRVQAALAAELEVLEQSGQPRRPSNAEEVDATAADPA
jgi:hypothetical protein